MGEHAAVLSSVSVDYNVPTGTVHALRDVDVAFPRGTSTAILGRSGSGKTTLISVLSLLRRPTSGTVEIDGRVVTDLPDGALAELRASAIGIAFQAFHLEPSLSATENVMLPWFFRSDVMPRREARARAADILTSLGIGDLAGRRPNEMSGGQRQRVAIGRALFSEPALLVADEPTGNLDEETANGVAATLLGLPARLGTTVIVVTHDRTIASMAERRLELARGELQEASWAA